jgi:GWxTD domain-containing protein
MVKAEIFFADGEIDSSKYYIELCYDIDRDYPPAHHLEGIIFLERDGVYNRRLSASALKKAVSLEESNPEYHYSLGLTLERQGYLHNALREFRTATELDPTDHRAFVRIAEINKRIGLRYDDGKYFERSLKASSTAAGLTGDPQQYYQQAVAIYQMDDYQGSYEILIEGLEHCDDCPGRADILLLLGTNFVQMGQFDSAHTVFERARGFMSQIAVSQMEDLSYLMSPEELQNFDDQSSYRQNKIEDQFWGMLDPDPTTEINERKLEHVARFVHSQLTFSVPGKSINGWRTKRGEMYIRYGRPSSSDYLLGTGGGGDSPKWLWTYNQFEEPVTFIFEDTFLNGDFDFPYPSADWKAADYDRDPSRIAAMLRSTSPQIFAYDPGSGSMDYFYMPRQFKETGGKTAIEVFLAIPYSQLSFDREGESALAQVQWRQVLRYPSWNLADSASVKRTYRIRASQVDNPRLSVADRLSLAAYPDTMIFAISIRDVLSDHITIDSRELGLRDFYTGKVEISDIVLARRIDSPPGNDKNQRGDLMILSNLDNRYFVGEPIRLYFEIYNLDKDAIGRTSYTLKQTVREIEEKGLLARIRGAVASDDLREIATSYRGSGIYSDENRILTLDLSDFDPGDYSISIEVIDEVSGQSALAHEEITLYR